MKTSEFIRAAVDAHLAPSYVSAESEEETALCFAFIAAVRCGIGDKALSTKAADCVQECLLDVTSLHATIYSYFRYTDRSMVLTGQGAPHVQMFRFMLAEFIALMLEDEGD